MLKTCYHCGNNSTYVYTCVIHIVYAQYTYYILYIFTHVYVTLLLNHLGNSVRSSRITAASEDEQKENFCLRLYGKHAINRII